MLASILPLLQLLVILFDAAGIEESMTVSEMAPPKESTPRRSPAAVSFYDGSLWPLRKRAGVFSLPFLFSWFDKVVIPPVCCGP